LIESPEVKTGKMRTIAGIIAFASIVMIAVIMIIHEQIRQRKNKL
jgi:hypothetical protein